MANSTLDALDLKMFWFLSKCAADCRNPKVQTQSSHTTGNVLLSRVAAFILEVDLDCNEVSQLSFKLREGGMVWTNQCV